MSEPKSHVDADRELIIRLRKDGTTNLDKRMIQRISDRLTKRFPRTAKGILIKGGWRKIEDEAPIRPKKPMILLRSACTPIKQSARVSAAVGGASRSTKSRQGQESVKSLLETVSELAEEEASDQYIQRSNRSNSEREQRGETNASNSGRNEH